MVSTSVASAAQLTHSTTAPSRVPVSKPVPLIPAPRSTAERTVPAALAPARAAAAIRERPAPLRLHSTLAPRSAAESTGCATLAPARAPTVTPEPPAKSPRPDPPAAAPQLTAARTERAAAASAFARMASLAPLAVPPRSRRPRRCPSFPTRPAQSSQGPLQLESARTNAFPAPLVSSLKFTQAPRPRATETNRELTHISIVAYCAAGFQVTCNGLSWTMGAYTNTGCNGSPSQTGTGTDDTTCVALSGSGGSPYYAIVRCSTSLNSEAAARAASSTILIAGLSLVANHLST